MLDIWYGISSLSSARFSWSSHVGLSGRTKEEAMYRALSTTLSSPLRYISAFSDSSNRCCVAYYNPPFEDVEAAWLILEQDIATGY
jgi:hypothetical protein